MRPPTLVLDGPLRRDVRMALTSAFRTLNRFRMFVSEDLDCDLDAIKKTVDLNEAAFEVVKWLTRQYRLPELVSAAARARPRNRPLRALTARFSAGGPGRLERIVLASVPFAGGDELERNMRRVRRAVCRIEPQPPPDLDGYGTGFLVAPDIVMTNFHVVQDWSKRPKRGAGAVVFRFDFERPPRYADQPGGRRCELADDWLLFRSPVEQLDFALIRVSGSPGLDRVRTGNRGYLTPVAHGFVPNETLIIFQHPDGDPLVSSPGPVLNPADGAWVTYHVNTKGGSSGSPCLTYDMRLVAIHHYGSDKYNRGVRCAAILDHLRAHRRALRRRNLEGLFGFDV